VYEGFGAGFGNKARLFRNGIKRLSGVSKQRIACGNEITQKVFKNTRCLVVWHEPNPYAR